MGFSFRAMTEEFATLERATAQMVEAKRFARHGTTAYSRLALLLLDNAAELSLARSARSALRVAGLYDQMSERLAKLGDDQMTDGLHESVRRHVISARRRKKIEREFDSLVDFVAEQGRAGVNEEMAQSLKALHRFRNHAYHRDEVRSDIIDPAVRIYFFLCCELLRSEHSMVHQIGRPTPLLEELVGEIAVEGNWNGIGYDSAELARVVTDRLREGMQLDHSSVCTALSQHLMARLSSVVASLREIADFISEGLPTATVLRIIQDPHAASESSLPADFWTRPLPINESTIDAWQRLAQSVQSETDAQRALHGFAETESAIVTLESAVAPFLEEIDREEDLWRDR